MSNIAITYRKAYGLPIEIFQGRRCLNKIIFNKNSEIKGYL